MFLNYMNSIFLYCIEICFMFQVLPTLYIATYILNSWLTMLNPLCKILGVWEKILDEASDDVQIIVLLCHIN